MAGSAISMYFVVRRFTRWRPSGIHRGTACRFRTLRPRPSLGSPQSHLLRVSTNHSTARPRHRYSPRWEDETQRDHLGPANCSSVLCIFGSFGNDIGHCNGAAGRSGGPRASRFSSPSFLRQRRACAGPSPLPLSSWPIPLGTPWQGRVISTVTSRTRRCIGKTYLLPSFPIRSCASRCHRLSIRPIISPRVLARTAHTWASRSSLL